MSAEKRCIELPDPSESEASAASKNIHNFVLNCTWMLLFLYLWFHLSACRYRHFLLFVN